MKTGKFTGEVAELDAQNFNNPLRRDIVHNVFFYFQMKGKQTFKLVKSMGDVRGSGIKPTPQKGRGAARQGNRRAPQRRGGGKAHGPVPRSLEFSTNSKLRLLGLRTLLSAKLYEDRLVFIDSEHIEYPKTSYLSEIVSPFGIDKLCFLVPNRVNHNFDLASRAIENLEVKNAQQLNVPDLLKSDYIFVTKQGLMELENVLESREKNAYRNKKVPSEQSVSRQLSKRTDKFIQNIIKPITEAEEIDRYDDNLPLYLQTEALKSYVDELRKTQARSV